MVIYFIVLIAVIIPPVGIPLVFLSMLFVIGNHICHAFTIKPEEFDDLYDAGEETRPVVGGVVEEARPVVGSVVEDDGEASFDSVMRGHYDLYV